MHRHLPIKSITCRRIRCVGIVLCSRLRHRPQVRKISLSEQASITEAFQGLQLDRKYMFGPSTPFLTVRDIFTGWIYVYPVVDKSKLELERVLWHIIGAKLSYKILASDSAPELLAASTFNLAHFALTPVRPQQSGHVERSDALVSELVRIYPHQSGLPKKIFWRAAVRIAVWARLNPSQTAKGEAKLYLAVFIGWVILLGSTVSRDIRLRSGRHEQTRAEPTTSVIGRRPKPEAPLFLQNINFT
eukprot:437789-Amphidinium_carterae.1